MITRIITRTITTIVTAAATPPTQPAIFVGGSTFGGLLGNGVVAGMAVSTMVAGTGDLVRNGVVFEGETLVSDV